MDTAGQTRQGAELPRKVVEWAQRFRKASDGDAELAAHGKFYSCSFLLDFEERQVFVRMHRGKVEELVIDPGPLDDRYEFAIRAGTDTWKKLATRTPPAMCHGIFAASFRRDMQLEGDRLVLMQNLRALVRQLELLRETGVPLGGGR